ncbi:DUF4856 domain-containing protein [Rhodohalobacter sulfatireducens]|uniref:DUF4856 domain-containing protein n=1 Tax=Rhodohalobacter sulfatireducens TaxID=2911366 RepID=A0ABS9K9J6_9BACT|nr:DUF4856 domain-containing protein [Rhodohalobacter sulfatireducens]MCG2587520.1 DUF4856 domain-containing protein [Rhodohalobacter sulfatireducens]
MQNKLLLFAVLLSITFISCSTDSNNDPTIDEPATYEFTRNGESTVSFTGQTTRLQMGAELFGAMTDFDNTTENLLYQMYRNQTADGGDADPYASAELNDATKNIKSKVAASEDYFSSNTTLSAEIKDQFEEWMKAQVDEVFPNQNTLAEPGVPGQIADGSSTRYVNAQGLEYDQLVNKSLIGALTADQMLNNYLSVSVLDAGTNRQDNTDGVLAEGANYTNMEHKWDEAYGYLFGNSPNKANPLNTIGDDDIFLNKYFGRVEGDEDFAGISEKVFNAFKLGRAAIVAGDYEVRDEQAEIIREEVSKIIGIRAVYYLQTAKAAIDQETPDYGGAFHDLSEGYGFIYSLMFTRIPNTDSPYFTKAEVEGFLNQLLGDGPNGLWDVTPETLDALSNDIAEAFDFTLEQAAS